MINQVDEVKKIQDQISKIERIRSMQRKRHERFSKVKNQFNLIKDYKVPFNDFILEIFVFGLAR